MPVITSGIKYNYFLRLILFLECIDTEQYLQAEVAGIKPITTWSCDNCANHYSALGLVWYTNLF